MMGVEERLPGGLDKAEEALLDPLMLDAALAGMGVPPLGTSLGLIDSRAELCAGVELAPLGWILLEFRGVSGSF